MLHSTKPGSVWWGIWRSLMTFLIMPALFFFCLIAGWVAMKGGLPSTQIGQTPGSSVPIPPTTGTTFAPKEYNKVQSFNLVVYASIIEAKRLVFETHSQSSANFCILLVPILNTACLVQLEGVIGPINNSDCLETFYYLIEPS